MTPFKQADLINTVKYYPNLKNTKKKIVLFLIKSLKIDILC